MEEEPTLNKKFIKFLLKVEIIYFRLVNLEGWTIYPAKEAQKK